jgi:glycosyltransferase involved in cell wall biosynthesis
MSEPSHAGCYVEIKFLSEPDPKIALVVCTRNRAAKLDPFFSSLSRLQCDSPWELIMVDNGSTDDTGKRLKEFAATFAGQINVLTEPLPGLGRSRNLGWRAARAPIIAFTDDDCYPEPDYLNHIAAVFADPLVGFAGGRTLLYDTADAPVTIYEHPVEQTYPPEHFIVGGVIHGANMAFRRQTLVDIEGFDDHLGAGTPFAFEDVDAQLRALAAKWTGKYDPRPVVYHHHGRKLGPEIETLTRYYDTGRGGYYMKCILFMPHRWLCLRHWLRGIRRQPFSRTAREMRAAMSYLFYQLRQKPNTAY